MKDIIKNLYKITKGSVKGIIDEYFPKKEIVQKFINEIDNAINNEINIIIDNNNSNNLTINMSDKGKDNFEMHKNKNIIKDILLECENCKLQRENYLKEIEKENIEPLIEKLGEYKKKEVNQSNFIFYSNVIKDYSKSIDKTINKINNYNELLNCIQFYEQSENVKGFYYFKTCDKHKEEKINLISLIEFLKLNK